jgi:RNA polymerase sigma-B factor
VDRDTVVARFLPLARQLAAGYAHTSESFDDLFQVACLGLVNAVDRFDSTRGVAFSSYAVPTILGELKRHLRDKAWSVRVPRDLQELGLGVQRAGERLTAELGRAPTVDEVAEAVGAAREGVLEARGALSAYHAGSLEESRSGRDDNPLLSVLGCDEQGYDGVEQRVLLDSMLGCLTRRERDVVRLRFVDDLTQTMIAKEVGLSQMQVSRVLRRSLDRLRDFLTEDAAARDEIPRAA